MSECPSAVERMLYAGGPDVCDSSSSNSSSNSSVCCDLRRTFRSSSHLGRLMRLLAYSARKGFSYEGMEDVRRIFSGIE